MTLPAPLQRPLNHQIARAFYRAAWWVLTPIVPFYLSRRARRRKEDPTRISERHGLTNLQRPRGPLVWVHGASVGESLSALALIERLLKDRDDLFVLVTTGTVTSAELMEARLPARAFHQYAPIDHPLYVRRFLAHWRPDAVLWFESEFWPNLLIQTQKLQVPMALLNARMSEGSFDSWLRHKWAIAPILKGFQVCLAQNDRITEMLIALGADRAQTSGNLKYVAGALPDVPEGRSTLAQQIGGRPVVLAAQTITPEEEMMAHTHQHLEGSHPGLLTLVAPRHPERGDEIRMALEGLGLTVAQRSRGEEITRDTQIYLADTMGELGIFYRLCDVVFLGRSLVDGGGGSNSLEPARLGCAILQGPHTDNFAEITAYLENEGAISVVADVAALETRLDALLDNQAARQALADAARSATDKGEGILSFVADEVLPLIPEYDDGEAAHANA
ncbi:MAG: 3-deoxy-D-manno-octulosonic acid transferase [Alphaproteobacteria bacterium]|nr:MAG: 3-deoxy-D-manno-octulosonic acid transferase [Alphaproteobacteria bacterium]